MIRCNNDNIKKIALQSFRRTIIPLSLSFLFSSCIFTVPEEKTDYTPVTINASENTTTTITKDLDSSDVLDISITEALLLSLERNRELKIERLNPSIVKTREETEKSVFDSEINGMGAKQKSSLENISSNGTIQEVDSDSEMFHLSLQKYLPFGTQISLNANTNSMNSSTYAEEFNSSGEGISVTQALLKDRGLKYNLASLKQAKIDTKISEYELRYFAETLVSVIEETYWDYALSQKQIEIYEKSLKLAENRLAETKERIEVGKLADVELAAATAEIAFQKEGLINAKSNLQKTRLKFLRLLNVNLSDNMKKQVTLKTPIVVPSDEKLDALENHVALALKMRADLNQANLNIERGELEIVKTGNGLLPKMDVFVNFGRTGYADSLSSSVGNINDDYYASEIGLQFKMSLLNRNAKALHRRALLNQELIKDALENMKSLVELDIHSAYIEVNRTTEQVAATKATRQYQDDTLKAEIAKFEVGKSTTLLVGQAQRNLLVSQIAEIQAVVMNIKSFINLYRLEGTLLKRRGISAPGDKSL